MSDEKKPFCINWSIRQALDNGHHFGRTTQAESGSRVFGLVAEVAVMRPAALPVSEA